MENEHDRGGLPWTDEEVRLVTFQWGAESIAHTASRVGRSPAAVRELLRRRGVAGAGRGRFSVRALSLETGYTPRQILRGIALAGIRPLVLMPGRRCVRRLLTEDQAEAVVEALRLDSARAMAAVTTQSLAAELGVSIRYIQAHCLALGVERENGRLLDESDADRVRRAVGRLPRRGNGRTVD